MTDFPFRHGILLEVMAYTLPEQPHIPLTNTHCIVNICEFASHVSDKASYFWLYHGLPCFLFIRAHPSSIRARNLPLATLPLRIRLSFIVNLSFLLPHQLRRDDSPGCAKNSENKMYSGHNVLFEMMWHRKLHFVERDFSSSTLINVYQKTFDPLKKKVNYNFYCAILQSRIKFDSTGQLSEISAVICGSHNCCSFYIWHEWTVLESILCTFIVFSSCFAL